TTINLIAFIENTFDVSICEGTSYVLPDGSLALTDGEYVYTYTSVSGCDSIVTINLEILPPPDVAISGLDDAYCINAESVDLYATPLGGVFSGTAISGEVFVPSLAGVGGPYPIIYTYTDIAGCTNADTFFVSINPLPVIDLDIPAQLCIEADPMPVAFSPAGGILSGEGISGSYFTPSVAGTGGPYTITYTYTDMNGCVSHQSVFVSVIENAVDAG
ncbi:MAG: hypothetical protein ACK4IY_09695, partial [Chitinophagales bacterium]